jgi:dihydrofolate reductase
LLIAMVSADGFISRGSGVPWDLPGDREHFRVATRGKWLLLGRRTFEEMTGWFRDHEPLVLTRRPLPPPWNGREVGSAAEAARRAGENGARELWVCGGTAVYDEAMPLAHELVLTMVDDSLGDGAPFPAVSLRHWRLEEGCPWRQDSLEGPRYRVTRWVRIQNDCA